MFRFEYMSHLIWLWMIPVLVIVYLIYLKYRQRQRDHLGNNELLHKLIDGEAPKRSHIKMGLITVALLSFILALANPQWGSKKEKVMAKSSDVFIALDISQSMMATDISPNRMERAKRLTQNIVRALRGNRLGLILFAGNAYLQMPLTSDYSAAELFVSSANTSQAGTQGTAISEAINLALRSFEQDKTSQRAMIIITDGESHDDEAVAAASEAEAVGLNIYTIGVGTSEGALVPYKTQAGEQYKRDDEGNPVTSRLNQELIKSLAQSGGGKSFLIGEGNSIITSIKSEIDKLEKEEVEQRAFTDYNSYFQYLIGAGLLLLLIQFLIPDRKKVFAESVT